MSRWNGRMGKGAGRAVRAAKREEAKERQARFAALVAEGESSGLHYADAYTSAEETVRAS